ncbi:hypothetical protein K0M31_003622 [Melipona bicolor]|uniref:Uncharacterized protein n=1 Tax=Melipona bicolor TaxID=60889 RepID=A0AA40FZA6_9HYME|nr:hypothetical protein K0M31_003622 [Melipona bicolor]
MFRAEPRSRSELERNGEEASSDHLGGKGRAFSGYCFVYFYRAFALSNGSVVGIKAQIDARNVLGRSISGRPWMYIPASYSPLVNSGEGQAGRAWDGKMSMKRGGGRPDSDIWSRVPFLCGARWNERRGVWGWLAESVSAEVHPGSHPAALRSLFRERYEVSWLRSLLSKERGGWTNDVRFVM